MTHKYPFWKPFLTLSLLGLAGIISLLLTLPSQLEEILAIMPELAELPTPLFFFFLLLQPLVLVLIANLVGCLTGPRAGFVSLTYEKTAYGKPILPTLKPQLTLSIVFGLIFSLVVIVLDMAFLPFMGEEFAVLTKDQDPGLFGLLANLVMGILYGGITEELLLRWGVMSLLVWLGWKLVGSSKDSPPGTVVWAAIFLSAILFGVGHLPAMAAMVPLTTIIVFRTVFLNAIGGIVFGWLYWRYSLEAAMVAHAFGHVGFFVANLLSLAFNLA